MGVGNVIFGPKSMFLRLGFIGRFGEGLGVACPQPLARVLWESGAVENPAADIDRDLIREIFLAMSQSRP